MKNQIGKVVFDRTLNQFAILTDIQGETFILEYADNSKRERSLNEVEFKPVRVCLVVG